MDYNGILTVSSYDALGRHTASGWTNSDGTTEGISLFYDPDDQLNAAVDSQYAGVTPHSSSQYLYSYSDDQLRRLHSTTFSADGTVATQLVNSYTTNDDLLSTAVYFGPNTVGPGAIRSSNPTWTPNYTLSYQYDGLGREKQITQSGDNVATERAAFTYNPAGELASIKRYTSASGNGGFVAESDYIFDNAGNVKDLKHSPGSSPTSGSLGHYQYTYDDANRMSDKSYTAPMAAPWGSDAIHYTYDSAGQLESANHSIGGFENFSYDDNGNRDNPDLNETVGIQNQIDTSRFFGYTYDHEGNVVRRDGGIAYSTYTYDGQNRLATVSSQPYPANAGLASMQATYSYDAFNHRISKDVDYTGGSTPPDSHTFYVYAGDQLLLTMVPGAGGSSNVTDLYLNGPLANQVLADMHLSETDTVDWLLNDEQQSVRTVVTYNSTNNTTSVGDTVVYDSFGGSSLYNTSGQNIDGSESPTIIGYTGQVFDRETGFNYFNARYYDPSLGRFITQDPIGFAGGDANLYRYAGNNPTNFTDPSGMDDFSDYYGSSDEYSSYSGDSSSYFIGNYSYNIPSSTAGVQVSSDDIDGFPSSPNPVSSFQPNVSSTSFSPNVSWGFAANTNSSAAAARAVRREQILAQTSRHNVELAQAEARIKTFKDFENSQIGAGLLGFGAGAISTQNAFWRTRSGTQLQNEAFQLANLNGTATQTITLTAANIGATAAKTVLGFKVLSPVAGAYAAYSPTGAAAAGTVASGLGAAYGWNQGWAGYYDLQNGNTEEGIGRLTDAVFSGGLSIYGVYESANSVFPGESPSSFSGENPSSPVRDRVLANIAESQSAREASNFDVHMDIEIGTERIAALRAEYSVSSGKNLAFADFDIAGQSGTINGVSGTASRAGFALVPDEPIFGTFDVDWTRAYDAEALIFEDLAARGFSENATGTIRLFSERPFCESCQHVIDQFQVLYPQIEIVPMSGSGER